MPIWLSRSRARTSSPMNATFRRLPRTSSIIRDVIGCEVFLTDGSRIGIIEEIIATGANDVFVVRGEGKEVLVPVIEDVVKEIDVAARRVVIEAVPGLAGLTSPAAEFTKPHAGRGRLTIVRSMSSSG